MSYSDFWEYEIKEFLISCIESEFEDDISADFFKCLSINDYELVIEKKCARSVLLVHGNQDYLISSVDLSWISEKTEVSLYKNGNRNLFFVDLPSKRDTYYLDSSAMIKIFNHAFDGSNCYIFRTLSGVAVGSMRDFYVANDDNNFCVTKLFNETNIEEALEFCYEFLMVDYEALPEAIINYSPQEFFSSYQDSKRVSQYDAYKTQNEDDEDLEPLIYVTHKEAYNILKNIGTAEEATSYDVLEAAITSENTAKEISHNVNYTSVQLGDSESEYSAEAYANAEVLLKEMLNKS